MWPQLLRFLKPNANKIISIIIILIFIPTVGYFITTTKPDKLPAQSDVIPVNVAPLIVTPPNATTTIKNPTIIDAVNYNLDITGLTGTSSQFQNMIDSLPSGSSIKLPKGTYELLSIVKLNDNITLIATSDVIFKGIGDNVLFSTGNNNTFQGIEFQNCATALSSFHKGGLKVINCKFTNNITFSAINLYGSSNSSVNNSYFTSINKYGILIDDNSSNITIDNNNFDNAKVFGGYDVEQISGHVYCLNGTNIKVTNNIIKNSGGQGIIFGYNSTTGKGTTNSVANNNQCIGNGQEGITIYGGESKVTSSNSIINNSCKNNRFNQIEVWQSDNNIVRGNTVQELISGIGNLGAICLFNTTGTTVIGNNILSAQSNGIAIVAGTSKTTISDNYIADTNGGDDINTPEKGNGILLDWNGIADPNNLIITSNVISSSKVTIAKSGIYSTSKSNHNNEISNNIITSYDHEVNWYALLTCGE